MSRYCQCMLFSLLRSFLLACFVLPSFSVWLRQAGSQVGCSTWPVWNNGTSDTTMFISSQIWFVSTRFLRKVLPGKAADCRLCREESLDISLYNVKPFVKDRWRKGGYCNKVKRQLDVGMLQTCREKGTCFDESTKLDRACLDLEQMSLALMLGRRCLKGCMLQTG